MNKTKLLIIVIITLITIAVLFLVMQDKTAQVEKEMVVDQETVAEQEMVVEKEDQEVENTYRKDPISFAQENELLIFDVDTIEIGDQVGKMTFVEKGRDTHIFSGTVEVRGEYLIHGEDALFFPANTICIEELDDTSLLKIPYASNDTRDVWFCLENSADVIESFRETTGSVTIRISNYVVNQFPSATWNRATLESIVSQ